MANITNIAYFIGKTFQNINISASGNVFKPYDLQIQNGLTFLGGTTTLTSAILETLIDGAQDASSYHHHDGRYFTEAELSSSAASSGSDLIGDDNTYSNFTPSAATIKGALAGIDTALATAGGTTFADDVFAIQDNLDATKQIAFQASGITTATTRTITVPDSDVDLGQIATNTSNISTNATDIGDLTTLSGVAANSTDLGTFTGTTIPDSQTVKAALQALETYAENSRSLINNFEWYNSALDYVVDNTALPATEVSGNRYILSHDGGVPNAAWDGASAGDVVEFNGTIWVATTPTTGAFISADDEPNVLYYWGGAAWTTKSFEATTASTGLTKVGFDIQLASSVAGAGLAFSAGVLSINVDDSTVEINVDTLRVKAAGITSNELATNSVTTTKITDANVTTAKIADSNVTTAKIADDAVTAAKINADVAGDGLSQQGDGSLDVSGVFITATNGNAGTISAGSIVRISAAGTFDLAQANSLANSEGTVGVLLADTTTTSTGKIQVSGQATVIVAAAGSLTSGQDVWLSKATAGNVTQSNTGAEESLTGNTITPVGKAIGTSAIVINIGQVIEVA